MQDSPPVRQDAADDDCLTADQVRPGSAPVTACGPHDLPCLADLLAESDRHDMWLRRVRAAHHQGYRLGYVAGHRAGYAVAEADQAAAWHAVTYPVAHPKAYRREIAARCLRAAEAAERRDQAAHERAFVARAYATPDGQRTAVQRAAVHLYPPPGGRRSA